MGYGSLNRPSFLRSQPSSPFENSGTWFAEQVADHLLKEIRAARREEPAKRTPLTNAVANAHIHLIVIRSTPCERPINRIMTRLGMCREAIVSPETHQGMNELLSPFRSLMKTREARGIDAQRSLTEMGTDHPGELSIAEIRFLNHFDVRVPLTWTLSSLSRRHLDRAVARIPHEYWESSGFRGSSNWDELTNLAVEDFRQVVCALHLRRGATETHNCELRGEATGAAAAPAPTPARIPEVRPPPPAPTPPVPAETAPPQLPELDRCENCADDD